MLDPTTKQQRFDELLAAYLDESIEADELSEFGELVIANPDFTADLRSQLLLDSQLSEFKNDSKGAEIFQRRVGAALDAEQDGEEFVGKVMAQARIKHKAIFPRANSRLAWGIAIGSLAVYILILTGLKVLPPGNDDAHQSESGKSVATVTSVKGSESNSTRPIKPGDILESGIFEISNGFVELEFASGAWMGVAGPARFELINASRVFCHYGKLRANVPSAARGFTVVTPASEVVDLGTVFALNVNKTGLTELHVFEGEVDAYNKNGEKSSRKSYTTGQAVVLSKNGGRKEMSADRSGFTEVPVYLNSKHRTSDPQYAAWKTVREITRNDLRLLAYYDFQLDPTNPAILRNISSTGSKMDGTIIGATWAEGPWPGKQSLRFKSLEDRVLTYFHGQFDALTMAGWIRINIENPSRNTLFRTEGFNPGQVCLHFLTQGGLVAGIQHQRKNPDNYRSADIVDSDTLEKWFHFAVVIDSQTGTVTQYINGSEIAELPINNPKALRLGRAAIGNRVNPLDIGTADIHFFNGDISEFMIFNAPLDQREIEQLAMIQPLQK